MRGCALQIFACQDSLVIPSFAHRCDVQDLFQDMIYRLNASLLAPYNYWLLCLINTSLVVPPELVMEESCRHLQQWQAMQTIAAMAVQRSLQLASMQAAVHTNRLFGGL